MSRTARLLLTGAFTLLLISCGGGGGNTPPNVAPNANAGTAQSVNAGVTVTLNGTGSSDSDGTIASYAWTQTLGTAVTLSNSSAAQPTFATPSVATATQLRFSLVVTDNDGASSAASTVTITVNPVVTTVTLAGTVNFQRVPLNITGQPGLKFGSQTLQPARAVTVQVLNATTQAVLATATTGANGAYSLSVSANTQVTLQVMARMQQAGAPGWDVRVQNGLGAGVPTYSYVTGAFNSSVGTQNVDIPSNINASGVATGTRASGPFAILDTIYTAMQAVLAAAPSTSFPALYVDWGSQTAGTHFTTGSGQHIALMGDLSEDTDEFDQHVVAHEFGHYIEYNFARSDSVGGPHGMGDRLDMRVAFGEGFGYAFAAIALNDPVVLDSFVDAGQHLAGGFHIESNPPIGGGDGPGCWCSESSVWSLLWDLHDGVAGAPDLDGDGITLGFAPIWQVMTGAQRTTPALTSIFSFITALKAAQPAVAAQINARVVANNMVAATMNEFATTETNVPYPNILPMYADGTVGTPVIVRSIDDGGWYNKAGNRRFVRFVAPQTRSYSVTLTTSNANVAPNAADPDYLVFQGGALVAAHISAPQSESPQTETGTFDGTAGLTYIIDAYDCANGCTRNPPDFLPPGVPGDYDLTLTIN